MQLREGSCKPGTNCYFLCAAWSKKKTSSVASEASVTKDVMGVLYLSIDVDLGRFPPLIQQLEAQWVSGQTLQHTVHTEHQQKKRKNAQ